MEESIRMNITKFAMANNVIFVGRTLVKSRLSDIDIFILVDWIDFKNVDVYCKKLISTFDEPVLISKRGFLEGYGFGVQIIGKSKTRYDLNIMPICLVDNQWRRKIDIVIYESEKANGFFINQDEIIWEDNVKEYYNCFLIEYVKIFKAYYQKNTMALLKYYLRVYEAFQKMLLCKERLVPSCGEAFRRKNDFIISSDAFIENIITSAENMRRHVEYELKYCAGKEINIIDEIKKDFSMEETNENK